MDKYDKLLNAEDLKDAIEYDLGENDIVCIKDLFDLIDRQNPAEARPLIHAHWEDCTGSELDFFGAPVIVPKKRCSHCKETNKNYTPPYCPHCGAVMDEEVPHETD